MKDDKCINKRELSLMGNTAQRERPRQRRERPRSKKAHLRMCGNTRQPRNSLVPSASLNSAAGVAADTLILESASFASWSCDRCARVPWARDQMGTGAFPQQSDRCGQRAVVPFFSLFSRRRTADTDKGRDGPRGGSGNGRWKIKILCFPRYEVLAMWGKFIREEKNGVSLECKRAGFSRWKIICMMEF